MATSAQVNPSASTADAGKRFALLIAGVVLIFFLAENFHRVKALPRTFVQDKRNVAAWTTFLVLLYAGFIYQPEAEDPSVTITFGAGIQLFSMLLLYAMPRREAAVPGKQTGDSPEFALLLAVSLGLRLSSTTRFLGYLPTDATGDGCYQSLEALSCMLALRGLLAQGLTPRAGLRCVACVAVSVLLAVFCYGDLDRRPFWDRAYATSNYVEFAAYAFLSAGLLRSKQEARTVPHQFLIPAMAQAYCRAGFWYLAIEEMTPQKPVRLMEYFPPVLVTLMTLTAVQLTVTSLLAVAKRETSILPTEAAVTKEAEPFMEFVASMLSSGPSPASAPPGLVPVRAVYEGGTLRVEYAAPGGEGPTDHVLA